MACTKTGYTGGNAGLAMGARERGDANIHTIVVRMFQAAD